MAVLLGYPIRNYRIANRQFRHHRTTSRVQVRVRVRQQRQTVTVQQIVIVTVVRIATVRQIVQQLVRLIVIVQFAMVSAVVLRLMV